MKFTIILLALLCSFEAMAQKQRCNCVDGSQQIVNLIEEGNELLVCGIPSVDDTTFVYGLTVYDCSSQRLLIDLSYDEIWPHSIKKYRDSIAIVDYHFAPLGDEWLQSALPFSEKIIKLQNGKAVVSDRTIVFEYPALSENQIDSIKSINKTLEEYTGDKKIMYPLPYETLYILFVGAFKDVSNSREIFKTLREKFEFDGAVEETLGEISFKTLIEEKHN